MSKKICVVGASNYDLIAYVPKLPKLGETLHGSRFEMGFGGKGANQAVMSAKLGAEVFMVTKLGKDVFGEGTVKNFKEQGVDTTHVLFTDQAASGVAPIAVDTDGNNSIIIVGGANDLLTVDEVEAARPMIKQSKVVVCQLEIPLEISAKALKIAKEEGVTTIFNPAPAKQLTDEIYQNTDILCPNETETEILTGKTVSTEAEAIAAAKELLARGPSTIILTLGERGSLLVTKDKTHLAPPLKVDAKDTTGAGDCFIGSFAYYLAEGLEIEECMKRANQICSISVQRPGTQKSYPNRSELPKELFN